MNKAGVFSRLVMVCLCMMMFSTVQSSAQTGDCGASYDFQSNILHVPCFNIANQSFWLDLGLIPSDQIVFGLKNFGAADLTPACPDDDNQNGIYRFCNYFPLGKGNSWRYTTGSYTILNETRTCSSGQSGVRYGTTTFEFEPFIAVNKDSLIFTGCQYHNGILEDLGSSMALPIMKPGETVRTSMPGTTFDFTLVGLETITVPAGTFSTLRFDILSNSVGECSFKTTLWLGKGLGPVKIARTDANPANCLGCMFVCDPNNNITRLNTPAELVSAIVDGRVIP